MRKYQITGVCLNPCIDRALTIDGFEYGGTNRVLSSIDCAGGKGFNVAIAAKKLGLAAAASGFLFNDNGDIILRALQSEGVDVQTLSFPGNVRINLKVYDKSTQVVTELNGKGQTMNEGVFAALAHKIRRLAKVSDYMVFGGSIAGGLDDNTYKDLICIANRENCKCVLDAEGDLLKKGIEAKPFMIKPNLFELSTLVGKNLSSVQEIKLAAKDIVNRGISIVLVSLGKDGAMLVSETIAKHAKGQKVMVKNTVGAGDSMVSGAIKGLLETKDLGEALRQAVASATCSVMQEGTGLSDTSAFEDVYSKIEISDI